MTNFTERAVPTITANFLMQEAEARYSFANKYLPPAKMVIDLACGTGYGSEILLKKSKNYIGVDINDEALSYATKKFARHNVSFLKMDVYHTFFKERCFDSVVAFEMIEHLDRPDFFLKEVKRILSKKGTFIVSTPNQLTQSPNGNLMSPYHTKEYCPQEFEKLLKNHFAKVTIYGQRKNSKTKESVKRFMFSQKVRQLLVDMDIFRFRKLFAADTKELLWKYIGSFVGRDAQNSVKRSDFLISTKSIDSAEYLLAVCKK